MPIWDHSVLTQIHRGYYPHHLRAQYLEKKLETEGSGSLERADSRTTTILEVASNVRTNVYTIDGHGAEHEEAYRAIF